MKKKLLSLALVVAMIAIIAAGSLAYFTDTTDIVTNTFTVGDVEIELIESYVHRGAGTAYEDIEGYPEQASGEHTDDQVLSGSGDAYTAYLSEQILLPGVEINKMPYVKNTGDSDAYIRIRVMIPTALNESALNDSDICTTALEEEFSRPEGYGRYAVDGSYTADDGTVYDVYTFIRNEALEAGKMTYWNVWCTILMDEAVESAEDFDVLVQADAIQATGFDTAAEAWEAFEAQA